MSDFSDLYDDAAVVLASAHGEAVTYRRQNGEEISLAVPIVDPADPEGETELRGPAPIVVEVRKSDLVAGVELHVDQIYWNSRWYRVKSIESEDSSSWVLRCAANS